MSAPECGHKHHNLFLSRLQRSGTASEAELAALDGLFTATQPVAARTDLLVEGEHKAQLHVLLEGWACGYRMLADGCRKVTTVLLPGDVCDLDRLHLGRLNYAVSTLTHCAVATLDCSELRTLAARLPGVSASLGWLGAVENATLVERTVGFGRRSARQRLAHLFCELFSRLAATGHVHGHSYVLPMVQPDISDVLGISNVHTNRVLQRLRRSGLITLKNHELVIQNWSALCDVAEFQPDYLHLGPLDSPEPRCEAASKIIAAVSKPAKPGAAT